MDNALVREFPPRTLDKVERLLDLLAELDEHPMLRGKWALHGGTAINLFMLEVPRLSVDIDLSYVGALDRDAMLAERPAIERSIGEVARSQGYAVSGAPGGHAGRTFILNYRSQWGPDHVKIDCIYLNRSPLMAIERRASTLMPELRVPLFADVELAGGKVKAFFDRVKVRDLYDIANLKRVLDARGVEERGVAHKVILFYASLSATFPHGFESRPERFAGRGRELEEQLLPMLRRDEESPVLEQLVGTAREFVSAYVLPQTDVEEEYLGRFSRGAFEPALLFENETTARAAIASPEAQWKLQNIRKMLGTE
ncbi:nucleotidyl transferase AbiEii/AbiGii toxin family protein [Thermophilibacter immobilis]|uniref:Nucleotidyl transferase AbiEii/AbiGii toxin family protein n=1 Tax=Thermophilibacter immobilis TaxID=2779519 RepID=A0A7S7M827_9ACTN|nr:nucleotidyl transferase AbiEii/AbiGii toxin family protein [Thermophilibacter immobilis]QOY60419.1 nucleotidyl transferase AbiEii/AbiGii toxin family protein [Thermophilibacter immobilis]